MGASVLQDLNMNLALYIKQHIVEFTNIFFVASGNRIDTKNLKDKKSMFLRQHRPLTSISTIHN